MCHSTMGLTRCYKTGVFYIYIHYRNEGTNEKEIDQGTQTNALFGTQLNSKRPAAIIQPKKRPRVHRQSTASKMQPQSIRLFWLP